MNGNAFKRRIERLENHPAAQNIVYAVHLTDVEMVAVCGTDERLAPAAFQERYPQGVIVKRLTADLWEAI